MNIQKLKNNSVEVGITEAGGQLYPVRFFFGKDAVEPMHVSPWLQEEHDPSVPPMLRLLRGDFFCAPFGDSNLLPDEKRGHGASANDIWKIIDASRTSMSFQLSKKISGAELIKEISINENESVVYQKHTFIGGIGKIPVGHHAMLKIPGKANISFSDFIFGGTPPEPIESDPAMGRSILKYPQHFENINFIRGSDDHQINASVYPFDNDHEDLYMVISKKDLSFGWSAVSCPDQGWLWYSIKNIDILPSTVVWLSNGGRYYPPFSSRHKNVIGIEETASFFHLGHKASIEENFLNSSGHKTYIELAENKTTVIPYLFGVVKIPSEFGSVNSIKETEDGIEITDLNKNKIRASVNLKFIRNIK